MAQRKWNHLAPLLAGTVLLLAATGCPVTPPAEAVLAGTWKLVPSETFDPPLTNWYLTFDSNGALTKVSYTFQGIAEVTWNDPPSAVNVDGTSVYISATQSGNGMTFSGTLNSTNTVVTGTLTSNLIVGGITITVNQGPATMTKQ